MTYTCCYCDAESETREQALQHECDEDTPVFISEEDEDQ